MFPRQKIVVTHDGEDIEFQDSTLDSDIWLRENKGSNANFTPVNVDALVYLNEIDQEDIVQISLKNDYADSWHQVFGGYAVDLTPAGSMQGLTIPTKCYGYDIALDRMRVASEYGTESTHPTLDTLLGILTDSNYGLIPKFTQKMLNTDINSGYTFNTSNILNETTSHKYILFPYTPINDCFKTILDLVSASSYPLAGLHWTVIPDGSTAYLCIDRIGNHTTSATKWPTNCPITPVPSENILSTSYGKQQMEANYVVYFGKYEYPVGEIITENAAAYWTNYAYPAVSLTDDSTDFKVGANCPHWDLGVAGAVDSIYYFPLDSLDISKIGTKRTVPTLTFYIKPTNLQWVKMRVGTGTPMTDYYEKPVPLPVNNNWGAAALSLGQYMVSAGNQPMLKTDTMEEDWSIGNGTPNWNDLDYVGFEVLRAWLGQSDLRLDNMFFNGIVTRGAYNSNSGRYKIKLITDSLAKTTNLVAANDAGTVAQLAKADLLRAMTKPVFGTIILSGLYPTILPGQIIPSLNYRITTVHFHVSATNYYTELSITDDVLNSYPAENTSFGPTAQYNAMMKAVNPDYQDRDRGNLKSRDVDIDQVILATDYA